VEIGTVAGRRGDGPGFGALNTILQAGFSCAFLAFRQATILVSDGISELQRRKTSGVHAALSASVPDAMLEVEYGIRPNARINAPSHLKIALCLMASPPKIIGNDKED